MIKSNKRSRCRYQKPKPWSRAWTMAMIRTMTANMAKHFRETRFTPDLSHHAFLKEIFKDNPIGLEIYPYQIDKDSNPS